MALWTIPQLYETIFDFSSYSKKDKESILSLFNTEYPPNIFFNHRDKRRRAIALIDHIRYLLDSSAQQFPTFITASSCTKSIDSLQGYAIVLTAGGEGERLRRSLHDNGYPDSALDNFSKATFPIDGFSNNFGTLAINLTMIAALCTKCSFDIPVVVTTGPARSVTAQIIPELCRKHTNFGLKHLRIIPQDERLFFTNEEQVVLDDMLHPIVHPDETGGPIMKLKDSSNVNQSILQWFSELGCTRTILVQATALYHQDLIPLMATALGSHDCCGVGILRTSFPGNDQYGTYVTLDSGRKKTTVIIEQNIRNDHTRTVTDTSNKWHLPFNTGFYSFNNNLLENNDLPDFATPPKELRPDLPRAPKIGYAATDLITLADDPVILSIDPSMFGVLKNVGDLKTLATIGKRFGLVDICNSQ